jgi:hypothetical protein
MDPVFPLLEYFGQAKYIPYDTEHFLEARGHQRRSPSTLDSDTAHAILQTTRSEGFTAF